MKILHVCSNYYPAHGGPQYIVKHLSEKLVSEYLDEVKVATSDSLYGPDLLLYKKIRPGVERINKVEVHRFPFNRWHYRLLDFSNRAFKKFLHKPLPHAVRKYRNELHCTGILKMMQHTDAAVIMATTSHYMFCDYPLWRFKTNNPKPFVLYGAMHLHISWPADSPMLTRAKKCDCYIANTVYEKNWLIEKGVPDYKIVSIGIGIDTKEYRCSSKAVQHFRETHNIEEDDILIGYAGRLSEGKGAGILLDAYINIYKTNKKIKLLLAGTYTSYVSVLKEKIAAFGLPVILLENFEDSLKPLLFNAFDIFVLASKGESFGVVFLEAWACKKPVIGVRTGAVASVIKEGFDGHLFEKENAGDLSDKINFLVKNPAEQQRLGRNGFEKVQQQYSWKVIIEKYRNAYLKAIDNFNGLKEAQTS